MKKLSVYFIALFLFGCAHQNDFSMRTRMAGQVRVYDNVPYRAVFAGFLKTVRSESFRVKVSDLNAGLILASYNPAAKDSLFVSSLGPSYHPGRGEVVEFVINIDKLQEKRSRARVSLQRIQSYNLLGNHEGVELLDFAAYRHFYGKIQTLLLTKYPAMEVKVPVDARKKIPKVPSVQPSSPAQKT